MLTTVGVLDDLVHAAGDHHVLGVKTVQQTVNSGLDLLGVEGLHSTVSLDHHFCGRNGHEL